MLQRRTKQSAISRHNVETVLTAHFLLGVEEPRRQAAEFLALAIIRALHRETNRDFAPSRVTFVHARNSDLREIHRLLRCPVEFAHRQLGVPATGECPRLRRPRIMIENPHFPRSYSHKTGLDVLVFDQEVDLGLIFDRKQWISTPGCTMLDFDTPP